MPHTQFREEQLPLWKELIETLFNHQVPFNKEWEQIDDIVKVLNFIGENEALNHIFLPDGGGLDIGRCTISNEKGCIELKLNSIGTILKPKKLIFQWFPETDYEWAYFMLEADELSPSGVYESNPFKEEELVEIKPGHYIERAYWDADEFAGEALPDSARLVARYTSGKFVIFSKASLYNEVSETYDGRHDKDSIEKFRDYIETIVNHLKTRK